MSALDDAVIVFQLALLTEDVDRRELGALRRAGERLEREWNKLTSSNVARRVAPLGVLNVFDSWGQQRRLAHAEWWERLQRNLAEHADC